MSEIQNYSYSEIAERHNAAYLAFTKVYELKNPPPEEPRLMRDRTSNIIVIALVIVMLASIVVSASRTIQEFNGDNKTGALGYAAFIMLEGGIIAYAFFRKRRSSDKKHVDSSRAWATGGLGLAFISALAANVDNTLTTQNIPLPDAVAPWVDLVIGLLVAISAPTLAFISGDVLAIELMAGDNKYAKAMEEYEEEMRQWKERLNQSWATQQRNWGATIKVSAADGRTNGGQYLSVTDGQRTDSGQFGGQNGHYLSAPDGQRTDNGQNDGQDVSATDKRTMVRTYLADNPDALSVPVRDLAKQLGIGKTLVAEVVKEFKQ